MSVDTIFAVASGAPPAALAIVRVSGPQAFLAARALAGLVPPNRTAALRTLRRPSTREALDHAIVIAFVGPQSATGEDIVEFHLHGGRAVVAVMLAALAEIPGLRAAEAGEFTRRALSNGRIDLAEAEGLADLLEAQTERQRRTAMRSVEGQLSAAVAGWTTRVLQLAARVEALLDFADEGDVGESLDPATVAQLASLVADIDRVLAAPPVERLRDGVRVVLAGPRNAGKSTLFNALVEREAAIVSPIAGTTRDIVETTVVRNGIAYAIADTAGLVDETDDVIEAIGIDRARAAMA
ncbi:MAG: tRNA uridine-5-carboxymethylaminomethyl(34) synthesis GTPase MnmE, partial [Sphingomonas hengshuiensis]